MTQEPVDDGTPPRPHALRVSVVDERTVQVTGAAPAVVVDLLQAGADVVVVEDDTPDTDPAVARLLSREVDIVSLVATGLSNQEIARQLYLSVNTVKSYIRSAYRKMGVESRSQAVLWAVKHQMVRPDANPSSER